MRVLLHAIAYPTVRAGGSTRNLVHVPIAPFHRLTRMPGVAILLTSQGLNDSQPASLPLFVGPRRRTVHSTEFGDGGSPAMAPSSEVAGIMSAEYFPRALPSVRVAVLNKVKTL